jgi:hypothetical protein
MAHFARLNDNNEVINVMVISDNDIIDENGNHSEELGIKKCQQISGDDSSKWVQTFTDASMRNMYAGIGMVYNEEYDAFIYPKRYESHVFNTERLTWEPPLPYPSDGKMYKWNEETLSWDEIILPDSSDAAST